MTDKEKIRAKIEQLMYGFNLEADIKYQLCKKILEYIDSLQEEPKQKFKIGDRIKFKGVYDEDVVRTITDIQKYDDGSCRYIFADGSLHSVGNNEIIDDTLNLSNVQRTVKNWKEPASEELEDAAYNFVMDNFGNPKEPLYKFDQRCFKEGAKWQAEQFEKERLKHCDSLTEEQAQIESDFVTQHLKENNRTPAFIDAIEYGMRLQKEQTMKDATECEVKVDAGGYPCIDCYIEFYDYDKDIPLAKEGDKVKIVVIKGE